MSGPCREVEQETSTYLWLQLCYSTNYPEAIPMKTVDAEHVAEELVTMFARVGELLAKH